MMGDNEFWFWIAVIIAVYYTLKNIINSDRLVKLAEQGFAEDEEGTFKDEGTEASDKEVEP